MKSSKLFIKILITLLTTMLIPFVAIFSMFFLTEKMSQDLVMHSSERVLGQFFAVVDNTMSDAFYTAQRISNNKICQDYAYFAVTQPEKNTYQAIAVCNELFEEMGTLYHDVFVYYPVDDKIASGANGTADADTYFTGQYTNGEYDRAAFHEILEMDIYRPHVFRMGEHLCIGMRMPFLGSHMRDFMVVIVLKPQFVSDLMLKNHYDGDGTLLIFDRDKNLLISSDDSVEYSLDWFDGSSYEQQFQMNGEEHIMQVQKSEYMEGYYAYVASHRLFSEYIDKVRVVSVFCILTSLALGVFVAIRGTSKVYKPIKNVVDKIESDDIPVTDEVRVNELDLIASVLDSNRENRQRLNLLNKKRTGDQRKRFILSWIMGKQTDIRPETLESYGISFLSNCFAVGIIRLQSVGLIEKKQQEFVIQNVYEEIAERLGKGFVVESGDSQYLLLCNFRDEESAQINASHWEEASMFLKKYYDANVCVYFSELHCGMEKIPIAFHEAENAERYRYLMGSKAYIDYASIKERDFNYVSTLESRLSRTVVGYVRAKSHAMSPEQFVDEVLKMSGISVMSSMDSVECFRYEIFSILNKAVAMFNGFNQGKEILEEMMLCPTLEQFCDKMVEFLQALWKYKMEISESEDIYNQAADIIHSRYRDSKLTLEAIGIEVKRTPYYVSRLFKDKFGMTVAEYIAKVRIEQAKKELLTTKKSVMDIAAELGFLSSTVFIRTFKKIVGVTPGKYRGANRPQEEKTK